MAIEYRTEYGLGRRGRVCRTYTGIQAMIAIAFDLALGLAFGVIGLVLWLVRSCVVTAWRFAIGLVGLPFRAARAVSVACSRRPVAKPAWASYDEF